MRDEAAEPGGSRGDQQRDGEEDGLLLPPLLAGASGAGAEGGGAGAGAGGAPEPARPARRRAEASPRRARGGRGSRDGVVVLERGEVALDQRAEGSDSRTRSRAPGAAVAISSAHLPMSSKPPSLSGSSALTAAGAALSSWSEVNSSRASSISLSMIEALSGCVFLRSAIAPRTSSAMS